MNTKTELMALGGILLAVALAVPVAALWQAAARMPVQAGLLLVVSPHHGRMERLARSHGGRAIGPVSAPFAMLVEGNRDTAAALRANGAWSVLSAAGLGFLCATRDLG